jgi:putative acetyltransferase
LTGITSIDIRTGTATDLELGVVPLTRSDTMSQAEISIADPQSTDVRRLLERHLAFAHAQVPPQDRHALDSDGLTDPTVTLYGLRVAGELLAVGALKKLDDEHAELKSMHTAQAARRHGHGRSMLEHLLSVARERGFSRVSIETGSVQAFAPARALYASAGFAECEPFAHYRPSPNSAFMTLELSTPAAECTSAEGKTSGPPAAP